MLASGIHYREFDSIIEREDGSGLVIWVNLTDGGSATLFIPFAELEQRSYQIEDSRHAPLGVRLH